MYVPSSSFPPLPDISPLLSSARLLAKWRTKCSSWGERLMRRPAGTPSTAVTSSTEGDRDLPCTGLCSVWGVVVGGIGNQTAYSYFSVVWRHCNFWCVLWRVTTKPSWRRESTKVSGYWLCTHCKKEMVILRLSQLQLNDILYWALISPILLRLKTCGQCVGCLQSTYVSN